MTATQQAIDEQKAQLAVIAEEHEGFRDYVSLDDLSEDTKAFVQQAINDYDRRVQRLNAAIAANQELLNDGFPDLAVREIPQAALAELQGNFDSIQAALGKFTSGEAATLGLSSKPPVPK